MRTKAKHLTPLTAEQSAFVLQWQYLPKRVVSKLWPKYGVWFLDTIGTVDDVTQQAFCGLIRAVQCYRPGHESGAKFVTYAFRSIERHLITAAKGNRLIHVPHQYQSEKERQRRCPELVEAAQRIIDGIKHLPDGYDVVEDWHTEPEIDENELAALGRALHFLPRRSQIVVGMRFGLIGGREMKLSEVGQLLGLTRERVRQIEDESLTKLRGRMVLT